MWSTSRTFCAAGVLKTRMLRVMLAISLAGYVVYYLHSNYHERLPVSAVKTTSYQRKQPLPCYGCYNRRKAFTPPPLAPDCQNQCVMGQCGNTQCGSGQSGAHPGAAARKTERSPIPIQDVRRESKRESLKSTSEVQQAQKKMENLSSACGLKSVQTTPIPPRSAQPLPRKDANHGQTVDQVAQNHAQRQPHSSEPQQGQNKTDLNVQSHNTQTQTGITDHLIPSCVYRCRQSQAQRCNEANTFFVGVDPRLHSVERRLHEKRMQLAMLRSDVQLLSQLSTHFSNTRTMHSPVL